MGKTCSRALGAFALAAAFGVGGCKMTPDEIRGVQAENELLREQIAGLKDRCDTQGRELDLRPEQDERAERREP
ncbi:MAG TPA: hypothetical protein VHQ66_07160 [Myxococcota bacterium]|nr:hypothetical protein [Myxococcota bacterium]